MAEAPILITAADCQRLLSHLDVVDQIEKALAWDAEGTITWPTPRSLNIIRDKWGNDFHVKMALLESVPVGGIRVVSHPLDESSPVNTRLIMLVDPETAWPLAIVDESWSYVQRTVGSIASGRDVTSRKLEALGGSSSVLSSAFCAWSTSASASSIITTRRRPSKGR